ncbi:DNA-binding protein [Actinoplanes sp. NPDC051851]|uniref:DNA-binding protein n=1 Tax=Actinoplanes sp. NPDC051851 TaxID=3154753 RepID=UPI0034496455
MTTPIDVMGPYEIRARLGHISRQRTTAIIHRDDFPAPAATLAMGSIWHTTDVEGWIDRRRPRLSRTHTD